MKVIVFRSIMALACAVIGNWCVDTPAQPAPGTLLWSYAAPGTITGGPAIAPDATLYLSSMSGLCAITNAGSNKWTFAAVVQGAPSVDSGGNVYFGNSKQAFFCLGANGSVKWSYPTSLAIWSSPALARDGTVYFVAQGFCYAFTPRGELKWTLQIDSSSTPNGPISPIVDNDGNIYAGTYYGRLAFAISEIGKSNWHFAMSASAGDSAAIGDNGTIYFTGDSLYAFTSEGSNLWTVPGPFVGSSPVIGSNGVIYVASSYDQSLHAISRTGTPLWHAAYGPVGPPAFGYMTTAPAIASDGLIYYASSNSVFAITAQGEVQWIFSSPYALLSPPPPAIPTIVSPVLGPDGTIYAAFGDTLYAIQGNGKALAMSAWPMYRQNARRTGKVEKPSLSAPRKRADANIEINLAGEIGQAYSLQYTSNYTDWTSFTSIVASTLPMPVADLTSTNAPWRFYRATSP